MLTLGDRLIISKNAQVWLASQDLVPLAIGLPECKNEENDRVPNRSGLLRPPPKYRLSEIALAL